MTTVFGMGTGMARHLKSPGMPPGPCPSRGKVPKLSETASGLIEMVNWSRRAVMREALPFPRGRNATVWEKAVKPIVRLVPVS